MRRRSSNRLRWRRWHPPRPDLASAPFTLRLFSALLFSALLGYAALSATAAAPRNVVRPNSSGSQLWMEFDNPLGIQGQSTDLATANIFLAENRCPGLPASGAGSAQHVTSVWRDPEQVAIQFDDGLLFIYMQEARTPSQYAEQVQDEIASGEWDGTLSNIRGTSGAAAEADAYSPAVLDSVEGACGIEMYGDGGQSLSQLVSIAAAMPAWQPPPPPCRPWECDSGPEP